MELIQAENIGKDYTVGEVTIRALDGVSFEIEPAFYPGRHLNIQTP